jgi:hypothetical protein
MPTFSRTQTIEHAIGEGGRFELKVVAADTQLRGVPGASAHVRATFEISAESEQEADALFEAIRMRVAEGQGSLRVEERDQRASSGFGPNLASAISKLLGGRSDYELTVEADVPAGAELRFEGVSADLTASGLRGEQRYVTVSGDLFLTELGGSARIESVSGDVTARGTEKLKVRAESVSGDISVMAPRIPALRAYAVSGDVEVEGELARVGEYRVETVSGDLTVGLQGSATFEVRGLATDVSSDLDHRVEGRFDRRRLVVGDGVPTFVFSSMSGDIAIRRPRRLARRAEPTEPGGADELQILQALERGEIDVDEATRRLAGE